MVDLKILDELGINAQSWRRLLEKPSREDILGSVGNTMPPTDPGSSSEKLARLRNRIRSRVNAGRDYNLDNWQHYHNLDLLWDAPFRQISATAVSAIAGKYKDSQQAYNILKAMNMDLGSFLVSTNELDPKTGRTIYKLDVPAFFSVVVPLVRSHLTIRKAKIINDRNLKPLYKFAPTANTPENRVKAEIVTDLVQSLAEQFDHLETLDQAVFQMLLYHYCIIFPREDWYFEEQLKYRDAGVRMTDAKPDLEMFSQDNRDAIEKLDRYVTKQGIRYFIPHPTRTYYDQAFNPKTLNKDIGCKWVGHWKVVRFRELRTSEGFYNLDKINIGSTDWWNNCTNFWNSVMSSCVMKWPNLASIEVPADRDRQAWLAENLYYQTDYDDMSCMVYEHYEKLIPSDEGLGDYPYPIWARFVVAGDGTIIYAAPLGYCPAVCFIDNGDANRHEEASLAQMLMPYQDQVTNLLTQYLLTVKQNLANLTLVDANVIQPDMLEKIRNLGERFFRMLNIFTFDSKALARGQYGVPQAIFSHRFQYQDTAGILQAIRTVLELAERVLGFSAQEVAQAATHEQTKREVDIIANTTSNILTYTGRPVDNGMEAMAKQNYDALMNYGEDDFIASISNEHDLSPKKLEEMGITVLSKSRSNKPLDKIQIKGTRRTAMRLDSFAVPSQLYMRQIDVQAAQAMGSFMRDLLANPMTAAAIGPDQALIVANEIARLAGLPMPKPLTNTGQGAQNPQEEAKQIIDTVMAEVMKMVKEGNQPILEAIKTNELMIQNVYEMLNLPPPNVTGEPTAATTAASLGNTDMVAAS